MSSVMVILNGEHVDFGPALEDEPGGTLLDWLREKRGLIGTKNGCGVGQCGACTVLIDGKVARACVTQLRRLGGTTIETIEALAPGGSLHPIQEAFVAEGAIQCGFCTPGMVMATKALLTKNPRPTEKEIRHAIEPNLCRCTGYASIVRAIQRAAGMPVRSPDGTIADAAPAPTPGATGANSAPAPGSTTSADAASAPHASSAPAPALTPAAARAADTAGHTPAVGTSSASAATATAGHTPAVGASPVRKDAHAKVRGDRVFADDYSAAGMLHGAFCFAGVDRGRLRAVDTSDALAVPGVVRVLTAEDIPGRNGFGLQLPHQPVLAADDIRYRGEPIAFVVAETSKAARQAARKIALDIEELPALKSPEAALAEDTPELHEGGNIAETVRFRKGDVEAAFAEADLVVEGEYTTPAVDHAYLEPEACLAVPGDSPRVTVYTANQGSGAFQEMIAQTLAIEPGDVRVVFTPAGGGFGGKEEPTVQIQAALAAVLTGRPVKVALNRRESLTISTKRHASTIKMRHAVKRDGTILGMESDVIADAGAYLSLTRPVVFRTVVMAGGPYEIPNVRLESHGVYTNTNPSGAFRGFGSTQIAFASELQLDKIARELDIDPFEIRRKNALEPGKVTVMGHRLSDGIGYLDTLSAVEKALERQLETIEGRPGAKIGVGVASAYKNVGIGKGLPDEASAAVEINDETNYTIYVGATDIGQGSDTVMAQIAADTLAVPYESVRVVSSDTASCPDAGMTTASRQTYISGNAVAKACRSLKAKINDAGGPAPFLAAVPETGRRVEERYRPPTTEHLPEVLEEVDASGPDGLPVHFAYCFTTMAAIVEVKPDGTELRVLRLITAQDVGKAIHVQNVYGQVEGAAVMGYGFATKERFESGRNGRATLSLDSLGVPRSTDAPELESYIVEVPTDSGPFGAKGIGEIPLNPAAPAISAAINDAIGRYLDNLPLTRQ
mgnify:CR=1 FL=1